MSFEKNRPPFTPEDYQPGSSDYPLSDRRRVPEAQAHDLSPEDQAALWELFRHWKQAKENNDTARISETANDINELLGRRLNDEDLSALGEALSKTEEKEEEMTVDEILKPAKITSEKGEAEKGVPETVGRERARHGTNLPPQISFTPERNVPSKISKVTTKYTRADRRDMAAKKQRRTNEEKPAWKSRRSQKRKTKMAA